MTARFLVIPLLLCTSWFSLSTFAATANSSVIAKPYTRSILPDAKSASSSGFSQQPKFGLAQKSADSEKGGSLPPEKDWGGDVEVGLVLSSGNTQSTAIRTNAELMHEMEDFRNKYLIQTLIQRNSQFDAATESKTRYTTAQKINLVGQSNYKFYQSEHSIFGRAAYLNDRFGAFDEQASVAAGYAMRMYQQGEDYFDVETGPGLAYQTTAAGERDSGLIWWVAANLDYHVSDTNSFRQALEWSVSLDGQNSSWQSRSSLTSQVNGRLSMRLNFVVKYDSSPGALREKTDTEMSATIVYSF